MSRSHDWTTPCGGYAVRLTAAAVQQMDRECVQAKAVATGGVLVGHYTADESTAIITEALQPPKDSSRGRSWFHRGVAGLRGLPANRWKHQRRTYYVGEWHYHPANIVEPSGDDLAQMRSINADPRYRCREPIMVIHRSSSGRRRPPDAGLRLSARQGASRVRKDAVAGHRFSTRKLLLHDSAEEAV